MCVCVYIYPVLLEPPMHPSLHHCMWSQNTRLAPCVKHLPTSCLFYTQCCVYVSSSHPHLPQLCPQAHSLCLRLHSRRLALIQCWTTLPLGLLAGLEEGSMFVDSDLLPTCAICQSPQFHDSRPVSSFPWVIPETRTPRIYRESAVIWRILPAPDLPL